MKKTALFALLITATPAFAIQYADFDQINATVSTSSSYTGTFNLLSAGAEGNSATMSGYAGGLGGNGLFSDIGGFQMGTPLQDATVSFWFSGIAGTENDGYALSVRLADLSFEEFAGAGSVSSEFRTTLFNAEDWADILLTISNTGELGYKVESQGGSFKLDAGMLSVSVPDGGATAGLLGLGLLGLAALRRRS